VKGRARGCRTLPTIKENEPTATDDPQKIERDSPKSSIVDSNTSRISKSKLDYNEEA